MKMIEAIEYIIKEHPDYTQKRVQEVLNAIILFQSEPLALLITGFDPEKSSIEESCFFLETNQDMLKLCEENPGTAISLDTVEYVFNQAHGVTSRDIKDALSHPI